MFTYYYEKLKSSHDWNASTDYKAVSCVLVTIKKGC